MQRKHGEMRNIGRKMFVFLGLVRDLNAGVANLARNGMSKAVSKEIRHATALIRR